MALKEVIAISNSDLSYVIKTLEEQGIEIEIIVASNDSVYTPDRIRENNPDLLDHIHEINGSHGEIFMDSKRIMKVVDELLEKKEK